MKAEDILLEYTAGGKNLHLEHLEDLVINDGTEGVKYALRIIETIKNTLSTGSGVENITVKWDGSPAVFAGIDPSDNRFFVGTKSVFAKSPKLIKSPADVAKYYQDKPDLGSKLLAAFKFLRRLGIRNVLQGDLLFTQEDLKVQKIHDETVVTFRPNTITYAVPLDTDLADKIQRAKIGVVFHTTYVGGPELKDMEANFGADVSALKRVPDVWFDDATYKDYTGLISFSAREAASLSNYVSAIKNSLQSLSDHKVRDIINNKEFQSNMKLFLNHRVREGEHIGDTRLFLKQYLSFYVERIKKEIKKLSTGAAKEKRKQKIEDKKEFLKTHILTLYEMFDIYKNLIEVKLLLLDKLNAIGNIRSFIETENGYKVTNPEGFVALGHDGGAVKLVDRLEFSKQNFAKAR